MQERHPCPLCSPPQLRRGQPTHPASAGVVLVKKLNSARFLAGQVQRVKDRSVLKVQNSKFPCARSSLRMKSDSRAFSAKCPTPSKSHCDEISSPQFAIME